MEMTLKLRKMLAMAALGLMAMGFGATVARTHEAAQTATHGQRMIVDGDIGDGTSPTKKG